MNEKEKLSTEVLDKVSGGTDFGPDDVCPICERKTISLVLYGGLHRCNECGCEYD